MFTNFLLCCCHACRCSKNVVIVDFNWLIVLSVFIVFLFAFASLVVFWYYEYRKEELNTFTNYRKNNDNNTDSANLQK